MDSSSIDLSGSKIFLVDDTPANLKVLRQALEPEGYSILIATNGDASLAPCPPAA
jgi:CheY-like chemotaxis protein